MSKINKQAHIPIEGLYNLRDLGGIPTEDGRLTKYHKFLRSDCPCSYNDELDAYMHGIKLKLVIDLRSAPELKRLPCALKGEGNWDYLNIPVMDDVVGSENRLVIEEKHDFFPLGNLYCEMLKQPPSRSKDLIEALASVEDGAVLFHCFHGKDRTGTTAALLLLNAGVGDAAIVANYSVSQDYLYPIIIDDVRKHGPFRGRVFRSDAENMWMYLDLFHKMHPNPASYFSQFGVSEQTIERLRSRLLD